MLKLNYIQKTEMDKCNKYIFTVGYDNFFKMDNLNEMFKLIEMYPDLLFCEYVPNNKPLNLKLDIDTFDDIKKIVTDLLKKIKNCLNKINITFDETDVYIFSSLPKVINNRKRYSSHIIIRGKNWCFNSRKDILNFLKLNKISKIDTSIYEHFPLRCPYSSKLYEKRYSLPVDHQELSKFDHFRYGLMSYLEPHQLKNRIKIKL